VPSLAFALKSSTVAGWTSESHGFSCVSRRSLPFSSTWTSPGSLAVAVISASPPSGPGAMDATVRRPVVSFSTAPPAAGTFAT